MENSVELVKRLGRGSYGYVYEIRFQDETFALKLFSWEDMNTTEHQFEVFLREIVGILQSPIFQGLFFDSRMPNSSCPPTLGLSMNLQDCNLHQLKHKVESPLTTDFIREIFLPVMTQLYAIHQDGLLHRDIKPANILLSQEKKSTLVDFSLLSGCAHSNLCAQTQTFRPPEIFELRLELRNEDLWQSSAADVFAFGLCILFCVLPQNEYPIHEKEDEETCQGRLIDFLDKDLERVCEKISNKHLVQLLMGTLAKDESSRWTMTEVSQCTFWTAKLDSPLDSMTSEYWNLTKHLGNLQSQKSSVGDTQRMHSLETHATFVAKKVSHGPIEIPICALTKTDREVVLKQFIRVSKLLKWSTDTFVIAWNLFDHTFSLEGQSYQLNDEKSMQNDVFFLVYFCHILFEGHHKTKDASPMDTVLTWCSFVGLVTSNRETIANQFHWKSFLESCFRLLQSIHQKLPFTQYHRQYVKIKEWTLDSHDLFQHFLNKNIWKMM